MSINISDFIETDKKYERGIALDYYGNEISIVSARRGSDGKIYSEWCYPQKGSERVPSSKALPWKITLGMKNQAVQRLEQLLFFLQNK